MVGLSSIGIELMGVAVPLLFLVVGVHTAITKRQQRAFGIAFAAFAALMLWLMGNRLVHHVAGAHALTSLRADDVQAIEVDGHRIDDAQARATVVAALRDPRPFSPNHGGWARMVPLVIVHVDGTRDVYRAAFYHREKGAVVEMSSTFGSGGRTFYGEVLVEQLPDALASAGVPLPLDDRTAP